LAGMQSLFGSLQRLQGVKKVLQQV
jgi:hypothetical protein